MKCLTTFLAFVVVCLANNVSAQKIKLKDNTVTVDGVYLMECDTRASLTEFYLLKNDKELVMVTWDNNETPKFSEDDWMTIYFLEEDVKVETKRSRARKGTVKWLLENKVITSEGTLDPDKVEMFFKKYDQQITERTFR